MKRFLKANLAALFILLAIFAFSPDTNASVLIWNNDNGSTYLDPDGGGSVPCEQGLIDALDANGVEYSVVYSLPDDLSMYEIVFVELGLYCVEWGATPPGTVGSYEQTILVDYLQNGGSLYMEGANVLQSLEDTELYNMLGSILEGDGTTYENMNNLYGSDGNFTSTEEFLYQGGIDVQYGIDRIMDQSGFMLFMDEEGYGRAASYNAGTYRVIVSSVVIGSLGDWMGNTRSATMAEYLTFLDGSMPQDVAPYPMEVDFGEVIAGETATQEVTIRNAGLQPLEISNLELYGDGFSIDEQVPFTIDACSESDVTITFLSANTGTFEGDLTVHSDDADEPQCIVAISGWVEENDVEPNPAMVTETVLHANYPNPFNSTTTIRFDLQTSEMVTLAIYNVLGQRVAVLLQEQMPAGINTVQWNTSQLHVASGMYFYRLQAGQYSAMRKMILLE